MKNKWILAFVAACLSFVIMGVLSACVGEQGPQGDKGEQGIQGEAGTDGLTPTIEITEDGYWVINGEKTEYKAVGQDGKNGHEVESVYYNEDGDLVIVYTDNTEQTITLPIHNHVASEWIVDTESTCEWQGLQHKECTECHQFLEIGLIPSKGGHIYEQGVCVSCRDLQTKGLEYTLLSDNTYEVSGIGTCQDEKIYIPNYYENKPVTTIGNSFSQTNISTVILPESIITIEDGAFYKCKELKNVQLNSGLKTIGSSAFEYSGIDSIVIPSSVETLESNAFSNCLSLKTVLIQDNSNISEIANFLFYKDTVLESVLFGANSSVTRIGNSSFYGCAALKSIEIPEGVTYIDYAAFEGCSGLENAKFPTTLQTLSSHGFYDCEALTEITIPAATESINHNAFTGCDALIKITVEQGNMVYHSSGNCIIETAAKNLLIGCTGSILPQDDSVTGIGTWAFAEIPYLKKIEISEYITSIELMSFYMCGGLEEIIVNENNPVFHEDGNCLINTKEKRILRVCSNSTIPSDGSVTTIQDGAFSGCIIQNLHIPACIEMVVASAHNIIGLENIVVEEGNAKYYSSGNCLIDTSSQSLYIGCKNSIIPTGVVTIQYWAFEACDIESIKIPVSVTEIKSFAFLDCTSLKEVRYEGTIDQWLQIEKASSWDTNTGEYVIICSDGVLFKDSN